MSASISSRFERIVFTWLPGHDGPVPAGLFILDVDTGVGRFAYGRRYLRRPNAIPLDPVNLPLAEREYITRKNGGIFGALADVLPDSWGKYVLAKRLRIPFGSLRPFEMLDCITTNAVGAISFGLDPAQPTTREERPINFGELGRVAEAFERAMAEEPLPPDLFPLLAQGTSLGGAQPKCPVRYRDGEWIAKFPNIRTRIPLPRIEFATMEMARTAGLDVPETALEEVSGRPVYLIKRFDRRAGRRLPFLSAQALCDLDIEELDRGSYVDIAQRLRSFVRDVDQDLRQLFRRMVFNAFVRNQDDHLRNHGFLLTEKGWRLSPLYDVLPIPARRARVDFSLSLILGHEGTVATLDNILSRHRRFNLTRAEAEHIVAEVDDATRTWREVLARCGVPPADIEEVAWSFDGFRTMYLTG